MAKDVRQWFTRRPSPAETEPCDNHPLLRFGQGDFQRDVSAEALQEISLADAMLNQPLAAPRDDAERVAQANAKMCIGFIEEIAADVPPEAATHFWLMMVRDARQNLSRARLLHQRRSASDPGLPRRSGGPGSPVS